MSSLCKNDVMFTDNILKACFHNGRVCMYLVYWMQNSGYGFPLIMMATVVMIMLKVIMMVNNDNNLIMIILWFNISRNIQGQEHAMEHLETSNTLPVSQTLGFLLDWTN